MKKLIILLILFFISFIISCKNDEEPTQYSHWLVGKWNLEQTNEYILFDDRDLFVMNDTIFGSYEIQEINDKDIWYYCYSENEYIEEDGEMIFSNIEYHKSMTVIGLPLHNEDTIKIYYIK